MIALPAWLVPQMPVLFGLAAGTFAKFGLAPARLVKIAPPQIIAQLMMLPFLGLLAKMFADTTHLAPTATAVAGGSAALMGAKLVLLWERFADRETRQRLGEPEAQPLPPA